MKSSDIKYRYETTGDRSRRLFFDRDTMRWFGDTMASFGVRKIDGEVIMYRKPSAQVNVFGNWKTAGRDFFGAWRFHPDSGNLDMLHDEEEQRVYDLVAK